MPVYHRISARTSPENVWPAMPGGWEARVLAVLQQLDETQYLPPQRIQQLQFQQLTTLVEGVRDRIPHYRSLLDQAGIERGKPVTPEAWRRLPVLTKADLQKHPDRLTNPAPPETHKPLGTTTTSGSTARPVKVRTTEMTRLIWEATLLRELYWSDWRPDRVIGSIRFDKSRAAVYPEGRDSPGWGRPFSGILRTGPGRLLSITTPVHEQLEWLIRKEVVYLVTYPSNALELARTAERTGRRPALQGISLLGETVGEETRDACRRVFGFDARDVYSTNETGYVAIQCPSSPGYHVQCECVYVEVVHDDGRPCRPGEVGRVLLTTLHNYVMPLFRYEIGDYAEVGGPCPCRRGLPVLRRVMGRTRNMVVLPDGRKHWPVLSGWALRNVAPVLQHQFIQSSLEEIEAKLVTERPLTAEEEAGLVKKIQEVMMFPFRVVIRQVDAIERSAGGKYEEFKSLVS